MNTINDILRNKKYNEEVSKITGSYQKALKITTERYQEEPCKHNIIVKFFGTICSYSDNKRPLYICLGCHEDLTKKAEEIEKDSTKYIIDFSGEYWYDVSKRGGEFNHYALVDYLRELAIEESAKTPDYTDENFVNMVNKDVQKIMEKNNFRQCG